MRPFASVIKAGKGGEPDVAPVTQVSPAVTPVRAGTFDAARGFGGRFAGGHLPDLLDERNHRVATANLIGDEMPLRACPAPALLINTIACADRGRQSLEAVGRFLATRADLPVINHPNAVARTARDAVAERLGKIAGVTFARVRRFSAGTGVDAVAAAFAYPVIVRAAGGDGVVLAGDRAALSAAIRGIETGEIYVTAFEDARDGFDRYRKAARSWSTGCSIRSRCSAATTGECARATARGWRRRTAPARGGGVSGRSRGVARG